MAATGQSYMVAALPPSNNGHFDGFEQFSFNDTFLGSIKVCCLLVFVTKARLCTDHATSELLLQLGHAETASVPGEVPVDRSAFKCPHIDVKIVLLAVPRP